MKSFQNTTLPPARGQQEEHLWRNVLQDQLGRHFLGLVLGLKDEPKQKKSEVKLVKIRGEGGKVA
jgi:hypothetical protein